MLYIGVDGGGTTTRASVVDISGATPHILGRGEAASSNHYSAGLDNAVQHIHQATSDALEQANIAPDQVKAWGLGLAGACSPHEQDLLRSHLQKLIPNATFVIDEDVAAAHAGAFGTGASGTNPGVICIAGTGSNSFGVNERGERARADGWGPLLGDRGSGYSVGEATLRAVCVAHDGSGPQTALLHAVLEFYNVASADDLIAVVYAPGFTKDRIAALFPITLKCAREGDAVANTILENAGHALATTCYSVLSRLGINQVAVVGGVLSNNTPVRDHFVKALQISRPEVSIQEPLHEPVIGAALLASLHVPLLKRGL